ncbi:DExH-box ATP-dependent RNA helicase DExH6 [Iris pallida]|uniref:RNA helicase n=1 Tax=Iris pallida TaxID=29817 RepID=A0AAX6IF88_IRIPA|nr:DExH-box ATP-dependent RNA helicase DExH6 [Iris pallida]
MPKCSHLTRGCLIENERLAHEMCRKMGMRSKSSGKGDRRRLSVYKNKNKQKSSQKDEEIVTQVKLSGEAKCVLQDLFEQYPPGDRELSEDALNSSGEAVGSRQVKPDSSFNRPSMQKSEIEKKVEMLASKMNGTPELRKIAEDRAKLPIASFKDVVTSTLETNQVVLIAGETGCGKTTQVPQYILDHMWSKGEICKIVCTQPRRISAISVAERISYERGEAAGDTVGYKIRLESKGGKHSSIMFCTNGILLRVLISRGRNLSKEKTSKKSKKDGLSEITHVIVDEIHERDRFSDFMLAIFRDLLPAYPHLRLILMSATIDADRFSQYFGDCPIIQVPGFTHPVKSFYLEDVLSILRSADDNHLNLAGLSSEDEDIQLTEDFKNAMDEGIDLALTSDEFDPLLELISSEQTPLVCNYQHSMTGVSSLMVFSGKGRVGDVCMLISFGADCSLIAKDGTSALDWALRENQLQVYEIIKKHLGRDAPKSSEEELLDKYLATINPELIDTVLIERLLKKICTDSTEGAVLVFLPGWDDINRMKERLLASPLFRDTSKFIIFSLHSMIPSAEQKKVFRHPPSGVRKIILSTNIAETAVTIDDVVYVIDSGRMKEKSYDPYSNVSTLHSSWVSKASAKQREGRAGRCQPGICYHMYSRTRQASLPDYQVPEIKRMPIEELCLQVKLLDPHCRVADFLQKTMDPPVSETVRNGIIVLQDIGALTQDENLTDLGEKLGALPVHPSTGRMLLFSILMNCLEPALTLACAADYREPFLLPMAPEERKNAAAAKVELASLYGGYSDQLAVVAAFDCWKRAKDRGQESCFCSRYFVSSNTMSMLFNMRRQLRTELVRIGFIPEDTSRCSLNAHDTGILRALLLAGTYPMVGKLLPRRKQNRRAIVETASGAKVSLHPHSSNFNLSFNKSAGCPIVIYDEVTRGDGGMYMRNTSLVGPYPLLLLAMEIAVAPPHNKDDDSDEDLEASSDEEDEMETKTSFEQQEEIMSSPENKVSVVVDRWLKFESTALSIAQIYCLRERLSAAMLFKVKNPQVVLPPALGASMYSIACILSYDGLSGISPGAESLDQVETNKSFPGRKGTGYIPPCNFLTSLMSGRTPSASPNFNRGQAAKPNASVGRFQYQRPHPLHASSTGGPASFNGDGSSPKDWSFKRRRPGQLRSRGTLVNITT